MDAAYEALHARGSAVREDVLGSSGAERLGDEFGRAFQEMANTLAWGGVWARSGLRTRDRCLVTVTVLTALGMSDVLPMHVQAALRHGLKTEELREALLHVGLYAGFPRASAAMKVAGSVLEDES